MKKYAVIVAGGMGVRMGASMPKQFLLLHGRPVLWHTVEAFLAAYEDLEVILVVAAGHQEMTREVVGGSSDAGRVRTVIGGETRFHSVRNGLGSIEDRDGIIFVHDGVRCLVSRELVRRCYEQAVRLGSAIPVVDCTDSVRLVEEEGSKPIDRSRIKLVQTPQTFRSDILLPAYLQDHQEAFTDEATVIEMAGHRAHLIEGEMTNIKITTAADLAIAGVLLELRAGG